MPNRDSDLSAVTVTGLSKTYRPYATPGVRLKQLLLSVFSSRADRGFDALKGVNLCVRKGQTVGILGKNGSGKSTLLQCICGIVQPTVGSVVVNGRIAALLELGAGFDKDFTGRENLYLNAAMLGLTAEQTEQRLDDILRFAAIGEYIDQPVTTYSSGMYVRLAFAIAAHIEPEILVIDEALAVGDIYFRAKCFDRLGLLRDQGVTTIIVTHDTNVVLNFCDQAYLLDRGCVVAEGAPQDVVGAYRKLAFSPDSPLLELDTNPHEVRYGDGEAVITEVGLYNRQNEVLQGVQQGEHVAIRMRVHFKQAVQQPVFTYFIRDIQGIIIAGTNTLMQNIAVEPGVENSWVEITFDQIMRLAAGKYLLTLTCSSLLNGTRVMHDHRDNHLYFEVYSQRKVLGKVDLQPAISIRRC